MIQGPIVIGGIGGSGTRVVVSILKLFNIYIGDDLNVPQDNLTYTLLFKRPKWFFENRFDNKKIDVGLSIMEKSMINNKNYSLGEFIYLVIAVKSMAIHGHNKQKDGKGWWAIDRFKHIMFKRNKDVSTYAGWGWKEPNSHLLIENLNRHFTNFKYIHTIRHGIDMAYSPNQQQLNNWGNLFGVDVQEKAKGLAGVSFRYWVEANRRVLDLQKTIGKDKIYLLNFDKLCLDPKGEIQKLIEFIDIEISSSLLEKAIEIPIIPSTKNRFKKHELFELKEEDIEFLHSLGFEST